MSTQVNIRSREPYFYPEGVYAGLLCQVDVISANCVRTGPQVVDVPQDASDAEIAAAVLALYGVTE